MAYDRAVSASGPADSGEPALRGFPGGHPRSHTLDSSL